VRALILLGAALTLPAACASPPYPGTQPMGTVTGHVLSWPCAPVENLNSPCAGRPAPGVEVDFQRGGSPVGSVVSDGSGVYSIQLLPGTYTVSLKNIRILRSPNQVIVTAGQVTTADLVFDNGIRLPVEPNGGPA